MTVDEAKAQIALILQQLPVSERYLAVVDVNTEASAAAVQNERSELSRRRARWRQINRGEISDD